MEELKVILLGILTNAYGYTKEQAAELLYQKSEDGKLDETKVNEKALATVLAADKERVKTLKAAAGGTDDEKFEQGYNKGKGEALTKFERDMRKKFGVNDDDKKGIELVELIVKQTAEATGKKGGDLTDDDVKKHPAYLALETGAAQKLKEAEDKYAEELKKAEAGYEQKQTLAAVRGFVLDGLTKLKPVLPANQVAAETQKKLFAKTFEGYNYQKEGNDFILLDPTTGKRMEDEHGNAIKLSEKLKADAANTFEFAKQDAKGNAGNETGKRGNSKIPANKEEYQDMILAAKTPEERAAVKEAWTASGGE